LLQNNMGIKNKKWLLSSCPAALYLPYSPVIQQVHMYS
jgi:hypothetical protein